MPAGLKWNLGKNHTFVGSYKLPLCQYTCIGIVVACSFQHPGCAKCGHTFIDELHSNKAKVKQNSELQAKWKSWAAVDNFLKGDGPPVVTDGKTITKIPNPMYESEIIVCNCWQNFASKFVGGQKCVWN
jgi:hypothetical protein